MIIIICIKNWIKKLCANYTWKHGGCERWIAWNIKVQKHHRETVRKMKRNGTYRKIMIKKIKERQEGRRAIV